jgi:23S rRNA A1618 N6-methylase RlmF
LVSDPKLLGAKGSSTVLMGNVKKFKKFKNFKNFKKKKKKNIFKNTAKLSAIALEKGSDKQNYYWINFGQEKLKKIRIFFLIFSENLNV